MSEHPTSFYGLFTSGYDYEAVRKWPKFWLWQVIGVSRYAAQRNNARVTKIEHDNLSKSTALGYAKLLNDANRREE